MSSIKNRLEKNKINFTWYKNASKDELSHSQSDVLLITINSLHKLLNENGLINFPNNYILWSDEYGHAGRYINSETLKDCRLKSYSTFQQLVKFSFKTIFSCADLSDDTINIVTKERKKPFNIIVNTFKNNQRIYIELDSKAEWMDKILDYIKFNKIIALLTDSKNKSNAYYAILKKSFSGKKILLINSENNNDPDTLANINEIVKNFDILICSPSLGIGVNVDVIHFDILFGCFSGNSLTSQCCQQMLNRIRHFREQTHYLHFFKINKSKRINDQDILNKIYIDIIKERDNISKELKVNLIYQQNEAGYMNYGSQNFITDLYVYSQYEKNISDSNFKYEFIKEIIRRGARFIIKGINLEDKQIDNNKKKNKEIKEEIDSINLKKINELLNVPLITFEEAKQLKNDSIESKLNTIDSYRLDKYKLYKIYHIKHNAKIKDVMNFILNKTKGLIVNNKINYWIKYLILNINIDSNEIHALDAENIKKVNFIITLLKNLGFVNGLFSINICNPNNFKICDKDLKEIRQLFRNNGDVGRVSGKKLEQHDYIRLIDRLCNAIFGIKIKWDTKWKNKVRIYFNYKLELDDVILEYLIINQKINLKKINGDFFNNYKMSKFKYSYIHGNLEIFEEFLNRKEYYFKNNNEILFEETKFGDIFHSKDSSLLD